MKSLVLQPAFLIASVIILGLIGGGAYVSVEINKENQEKDALVERGQRLASGHASAEEVVAELARARLVARAELDRLNLFVNYPNSPEALAAVREEVYENVLLDVIRQTDALFKVEQTSREKIFPVDNLGLQIQIAASRAHIQEVLEQWQQLINSSSSQDPASEAQVTAYAAEVKEYIEELQDLVEQLTPENSDLTQEEIVEYQETVTEAVNEINEAIDNIQEDTVPPTVIQDQEDDVEEANEDVDELEEELEEATNPSDDTDDDDVGGTGDEGNIPYVPPDDSSTGSGGNGTGGTSGGGNTGGGNNSSGSGGQDQHLPGTRYIPPVPQEDPNKPKLIEGQNPNQ